MDGHDEKKLQIVRVNNLTVERIDLQIGNNIIGFGAATESEVDAVPEHAVTINLGPTGEMTITPMLNCYIKRVNSAYWQWLNVSSTVPIEIGDICSILPNRDKTWFVITFGSSLSKMENDCGKRKSTVSSEDEPPEKKLRACQAIDTTYAQCNKVSDGWNGEEVSTVQASKERVSPSVQANISKETSNSEENKVKSDTNGNKSLRDIWINPEKTDTRSGENLIDVPADDSSTTAIPTVENADSSGHKDAYNQNRDEAGKKITWDCGRHFSDQPDQASGKTPEAEKKDDSSSRQEINPTAEANASADEPPRNKCAYGTRCYRRSAQHRANFSHPGDADYDVPDTRPECPYGIRCYRKNPEHKLNYKHTRIRSIRAQTPVRGRTSDAASGTEQSSAEESVDDSEYEPSFGATSDEYRSDLDWISDFEAVSDIEDDK